MPSEFVEQIPDGEGYEANHQDAQRITIVNNIFWRNGRLLEQKIYTNPSLLKSRSFKTDVVSCEYPESEGTYGQFFFLKKIVMIIFFCGGGGGLPTMGFSHLNISFHQKDYTGQAQLQVAVQEHKEQG